MFLLSATSIINSLGDPYDPIIKGERTVIGFVLNWIRIVGTGVALIVLTILAIRYFTSPPGPRAELKKSFYNYVFGAMIFIGTTNIVYFVEQLVEDILKGSVG